MQEKAPQRHNSPTFKEKLIPHQEHGTKTKEDVLLQPESRSDVVVRALNWEEALANSKFNPVVPDGGVSVEEYATITKKHFDELGSYGIKSPVQFVVAERERKIPGNSTRDEVYAIVDNITADKNPQAGEMLKEYTRVYKALLTYYTDKFEKGGSYLADVWKETNYVYGKKSEDESDKLYLTDVDPYIYRDNKILLRIMASALSEVERQSEHFNNPPEYQEIVTGFEQLIKKIEEKLKK